MACTTSELEAVIASYSGGSMGRYRHPFNPKFIFTEGVEAMAQAAQSFWLLDTIALKMAPTYAKAWLEDGVGIGVVTLEVAEDSTATLKLTLQDDVPPAVQDTLDFTDFPVGKWDIFLGTDEVADNSYVTTAYLPVEH